MSGAFFGNWDLTVDEHDETLDYSCRSNEDDVYGGGRATACMHAATGSRLAAVKEKLLFSKANERTDIVAVLKLLTQERHVLFCANS